MNGYFWLTRPPVGGSWWWAVVVTDDRLLAFTVDGSKRPGAVPEPYDGWLLNDQWSVPLNPVDVLPEALRLTNLLDGTGRTSVLADPVPFVLKAGTDEVVRWQASYWLPLRMALVREGVPA